MGRISYFLCFMVAASAISCAGQPTIPTGTNEDQAAICIRAVTTVRKATTALLRAGKISLERDREVQDGLNTAATGCRELAP
jgi:hypothetical protein